MHNQTFTDDSECSSMTGLQRTQKGPCNSTLYLPALAPSCSSHQVQDTDFPERFHSLFLAGEMNFLPPSGMRNP